MLVFVVVFSWEGCLGDSYWWEDVVSRVFFHVLENLTW